MGLREGHVSVLALLVALACISAEPHGGGGYNSGYNSVGNPLNNPCNYMRCMNGGYCDYLSTGRAECACPAGYTGSTCELGNHDKDVNTCVNFLCENGGHCDTDGVGRPHCHCATGFYGSRCESKQAPPQSIVSLRCDNACSTATSCRICLPCDQCQYETVCMAYEKLVKSLDAECHAQGYQEALLMKSTSSPLGYTQIKCRGYGPIRDCPQGSSCVDDGKGGGTCCRNKVGLAELENRQGYCPARDDTQSCGRLSCQGDIDCAGNLKCCPLCGNKCTIPSTYPPVERVIDPCLNFGCQNGGRCNAPAGAAYCECPSGFSGTKCQTREETCQTFTCLNGGQCVLQGGKPSCECPRDYRGPRCGIRDEPCRNFRCENGGRCVTRGDEPICQCPVGFRGPRCGLKDDPCQELRCLNGARCVLQGTVAVCECPVGYTGPRCGIRSDPCQELRCLNGARCVLQGTVAVCECPVGYTGPRCGIRSDPCQSMICHNGGRCVSQGTSAYCSCLSGYSGPGCADRVITDPCQSMICHNGGRCVSQGTSAYCSCLSGYSGPGCADRAFQVTPSPCQLFGCDNSVRDQCGGCPHGWTCQQIVCSNNGCPSAPTYRCVSILKKK